MAKYLVLVALVAVLSKRTWAIDSDCDYNQNLEPGQTYYLYNPEYPSAYSGERSCGWYAQSATRIRLSCDLLIPGSENCTGDRLSVSQSGNLSDAHNYCGTGTFNLTSDGNDMFIAFTSLNSTGGGRFLCALQATADDTTLTCECGWKKQMRIVGGTETGVNEYPSMAGILNLENRIIFCGATIISTKYVLSAAHCFMGLPLDVLVVVVGEHGIEAAVETTASRFHRVDRVSVHPAFTHSTGLGNDIAVVTVSDTIVFSMEVGPACLPFQHANAPFDETEVTALGWGSLQFGGAMSKTLQKVDLNMISLSTCNNPFPDVTTRQMCTYSPGKDACQYDSGGPLLWQNPATMRLVLAGIISSGGLCADTVPGVSTRVGAYMDWILSVTPGANYCRVE